MKKNRLLKLADLLIAEAKKSRKARVHFDLASVGRVVEGCGSFACAWGLAALSGAFARQGLGYKVIGDALLPTYDGSQGMSEPAMRFFNISQMQSDYLFMPLSYPLSKRRGPAAARYVAKRIRDLVRADGRPPAAWRAKYAHLY